MFTIRERMINLLAVLFFFVEGDVPFRHGRISKRWPEMADKIEGIIVDHARIWTRDPLFWDGPLAPWLYFTPRSFIIWWTGYK